MNEAREIERAMQERRAQIQTPEDQQRFNEDFGVGHAFVTHPACDPVNEVYYFDFEEKRNKAHR